MSKNEYPVIKYEQIKVDWSKLQINDNDNFEDIVRKVEEIKDECK